MRQSSSCTKGVPVTLELHMWKGGSANGGDSDVCLSRNQGAIPLGTVMGGTLFDKEDADVADDASRRMLVS